MFLFVRELTGTPEAALVAGAAYAFAPYRIAALPHLQVLSCAWLPFALYAFRRYFGSGRPGALAAAVAAWLAQNLSCGYYLFYFSPVIVLYVIWEMSARRLWTNTRAVVSVAAALVATVLLTVPFLLPYLAVRNLGFSARGVGEVDRFAADVYAYLTAAPNLHLWGSWIDAWPKAEGALFPGLTIAALAAAGALQAWRGARFSAPFTAFAAFASVVLLALLFGRTLRVPGLKVASLGRAASIAIACALAVFAASGDTRKALRRWLAQPAALWSLVTALAAALSFGTRITAKGRTVLDHAPYELFYRYIPGFDGLRVPSRFAVVVMFALAALAGLAVAAVQSPRHRSRLAVVAAICIVIEFLAVPLPVNGNSTTYARSDLAPLPDSVDPGAGAPAVYRFIAALPPTAAIVELPLGEPAFDIRYMFYSTLHWRPLVNGYSGGTPPDYELLSTSLQEVRSSPERAWNALLASRASHVIVHEQFYRLGGAAVTAWIRGHGGREVARFGGDCVLELPRQSVVIY
jgi:hypothetical protein